ncbi:MAG: flagellar hook basal-body protein [Gemmatimonadetes bacterium]|nr:flagellar hook basal-body protein [Gemmatimonadota bacterium]
MGTSITPTGFDSAVAALRYWDRRQEVVASNLANVNTDGFKGERAFAHLLDESGTVAIGTATDLRPGTMRPTGQPLDVAIDGDGFLVVDTPQGERLSRGGTLRLDDQRRLVDPSGHLVLGDGDGSGAPAAITFPSDAAKVAIGRDGTITADGSAVGRLRVERAAPGATLTHAGDTLFAASATEPVAPTAYGVRQGAREESNVHPLTAMVDMIDVQRAFGTVQKALSTLDTVRGIAVTELGKPV